MNSATSRGAVVRPDEAAARTGAAPNGALLLSRLMVSLPDAVTPSGDVDLSVLAGADLDVVLSDDPFTGEHSSVSRSAELSSDVVVDVPEVVDAGVL